LAFEGRESSREYSEKGNVLAFEGRESSRVPDVVGEIVADVGAKERESAKAMGFVVFLRLKRTRWDPEHKSRPVTRSKARLD